MIRRPLNLSESKTFFLFGARGTGKSTLLHETLLAAHPAGRVKAYDCITLRRAPAWAQTTILAREAPVAKPAANKLIIINRAVPGSGKSTIAKCILDGVRATGHAGSVHSTDAYFMSSQGTYDFDPAQLAAHHRSCLDAFCRDVEAGVALVICDNTNLAPWQCEDYAAAARMHGYRIVILGYAPRDLAAHVRSQQITVEKPDAHQVPESTIREMITEYHAYKKFLDKAYVIDPHSDLRERWNAETLSVEKTDIPLRHYDSDVVLEVMPDEYAAAKRSMPEQILDLMGLRGG